MRSLRSALRLLAIPAVLVVGLRACHEVGMRRSRDEGARFRALAESDVQTVSIFDDHPDGEGHRWRVTADPLVVRRCLAAVRKAQRPYDETYGNSRIIFEIRKTSRRAVLRLNLDTVKRDFGPEIAACVADVRRLGAPEY